MILCRWLKLRSDRFCVKNSERRRLASSSAVRPLSCLTFPPPPVCFR